MRVPSMLKRTGLVALALMGIAAAAASAAAPAKLQIPIARVAFSKTDVSVSVGDTVEWVNNDIVDHTATDRKDHWNLSIAPGKSSSVVMKTAGTFEYFCRYHPNMVGHIVVNAAKKK
jgi:plastocyanin